MRIERKDKNFKNSNALTRKRWGFAGNLNNSFSMPAWLISFVPKSLKVFLVLCVEKSIWKTIIFLFSCFSEPKVFGVEIANTKGYRFLMYFWLENLKLVFVVILNVISRYTTIHYLEKSFFVFLEVLDCCNDYVYQVWTSFEPMRDSFLYVFGYAEHNFGVGLMLYLQRVMVLNKVAIFIDFLNSFTSNCWLIFAQSAYIPSRGIEFRITFLEIEMPALHSRC